MKNCTYKIKIQRNGKEEIIELRNEAELDNFLQENDTGKNWVAKVNSAELIFSIDPQQQTISKLDEITKVTKTRKATIKPKDTFYNDETNIDADEVEVTLENTLGVTSALSMLKQPGKTDHTLVKAFEEAPLKEKRIVEMLANRTANSREEAEQLFEKEKSSWDFYRKAGEEIHDIFQSVIQNKQENKHEIITDEALLNNIRKQAVDFLNDIHNKYGKNAQVYSEFSIISKELDPDVQTMLEKGAKVDAFSGRIDMLVVDEKGKVHVYDFKVSRKDVGDWNQTYNPVINKSEWPSSKKLATSYQLAFYNAILRQYNITPTSMHIVPIHIDINYSDSSNLQAVGISGVKINPVIDNPRGVLAGTFLDNAMYYVPSTHDFKEMRKVRENYQKLMPTTSVDSQVRHFTANIDYYKQKEGFIKYLTKADDEYPEYKMFFYKNGLPGNKKIYCKDEEDRDKKLADYVNELNDKNGIQLVQLGIKIKEAINGKIDWKDVADDFGLGQSSYLSHQLERYIKNKWLFQQNETANAAGIFVFSKAGKSEIIMMTEKPLNTLIKLNKGHSLLGNYYDDSKWDRTRWLGATNGNLKLIQALCYVAENPEYFKTYKIAEIKCVNPWHEKEVNSLNETLLDNFDRLNTETKAGIKLDKNCFLDDITALVEEADDRVKMLDLPGSFCIIDEAVRETYTQQWLLSKISALRHTYKDLNDSTTYNATNPAWQALTYLMKAYLKIMGYQTFNENDPDDWINKGYQWMGLRITSGQNSPSANMRMLYKLINQYSTDVRQETLKVIAPVQKAFKDFFEEKGQIKILGGEYRYFDEWFEKDQKGNILPSFTLVDPDDSNVHLSEKSRTALRLFLDTLGYLRNPNASAEQIEAYKHDIRYRQVPILERRFLRRLFSDPIKAISMEFKKNKNLYDDVFGEKDEEREEFYKNDLAQERLFNRFTKYDNDLNLREDLIKRYGVESLETDLERVFLEAAQAYIKAQVSRKYIPAINAFKLSMKYMQEAQNNKLESTYKAMIDSIESKIYNNPIMSSGLRGPYGILSSIRQIFSGMTLGLSSKAFAREIIQGFWNGLSRSMVEQMPGITLDTYTKAFMLVLHEAPNNANVMNKLPQLNAIYGMANYSLNDIAEQQRLNWYGIRNMSQQSIYITSSAPDFQHRVAILVAKMMGDGCYEASMEIGPDGKLAYNFKKDKRYQAYINGDKNNPDYAYQKALYLENLKQFNREGYNLQEGDDLPLAYTNREILQITQFSDLLYGHYNAESKALINDSFLGAFFMQFRTWAIAGLERWFLAPGIYNGESPGQQYTEDGEEIWYYYDSKEDKDEIVRHICRKSQVPEQAMKDGLAEPLIQFDGNPMEGIFYSMLAFTKSIFTMDWNHLKELWNDPLRRKNLKLGIWDLFIMGLFTALMTLLFSKITGEENIAKNITSQNWITQWTYGVLTGSTQDGMIHQILGDMLGDLNPPLVGQLQRFAESTWGIITGDDNVVHAITRNFGAVREFQGLAKQLTE